MCGRYDQLILEHASSPRRFGHLEAATNVGTRVNRLCGDKVTVELRLSEETIVDYAFTAEGCAISIASASILGDLIQNGTVRDATDCSRALRQLIESDHETDVSPDLKILADVGRWPGRKNCVLLAWQAMDAAIQTQ